MGTYTTNYNLFMPSIGEQGWGELVNGNFVTIDATMKGLDIRVGTLETETDAIEERVTILEAGNFETINVTGSITANELCGKRVGVATTTIPSPWSPAITAISTTIATLAYNVESTTGTIEVNTTNFQYWDAVENGDEMCEYDLNVNGDNLSDYEGGKCIFTFTDYTTGKTYVSPEVIAQFKGQGSYVSNSRPYCSWTITMTAPILSKIAADFTHLNMRSGTIRAVVTRKPICYIKPKGT